jgi:hypothetical protein
MREGSGTAGAIAGMLLFFFVLLPAVLFLLLWVFFLVYAATKWSAFDAQHVNVPFMLTGVCVITAALATGLFGGIAWIGKALSPPRERGDRRRGRDELSAE